MMTFGSRAALFAGPFVASLLLAGPFAASFAPQAQAQAPIAITPKDNATG